MTKIISLTFVNLVTPKAGAKHDLLFKKRSLRLVFGTGASLLNKSSCLTPALGVAKFITDKDMILVTLFCAT